MGGSSATMRRVGRRGFSVAAVFAMVAVWLPAMSFTSVAHAADPVQVQMTLEGCNRPAVAALCTYDDDFTTGNLGKNWAELDYVPYRLTMHNNGGAQQFSIRLSSDFLLNGTHGYDFIKPGWDGTYTDGTAPMFSAGCGDATVDTATLGGDPSPTGVVGGVDKVKTIKVTVDMADEADCLISYQVRLSIEAHDYSGASLQSQVLEADYDSIGQRTVSIFVNEIAPQVAGIEATASRTNNYIWTVGKTGDGPLVIDSCDPDATEPNANYEVTYTRTKQSGENYQIEGTVTLENPATRVLTTHSIDVTINDDDTNTDYPATVDDETITVPAATSGGPGTATADFTAVIPAPIGNLSAQATVTYDDPDQPGVQLPGLDTESVPVDVVVSETDTDATADLSDTESFTGTNPAKFEYKRTAPHATSGFTSGDTFTDNNLSGSDSFDIHKIVRVTEPGNFSANLHNVVTITPDDTGEAGSDTATSNIAITSTADDPEITITKSVDLAPTTNATFDFTITSNDDNTKFWTTSVTILAGETSGTSDPVSIAPSASGYALDEDAAPGYDPVSTSIGPMGFCDTDDIPVSNNRQLGHVRVEKVLDGPAAGADTTFTFDVECDNGYTTTLTVEGDGFDQTDDVIPTGVECTITEQTPPTGWEESDSDPADGGATAEQTNGDANTVTITNTRLLGHITVDKTLVGDVAGAPTTFTFAWDCPAVGDYEGDSGTLEVNGEGTASTGDVIPTGVTCTITETDIDAHWELTATSPENGEATSAEEDGTGNTVFFTNTRVLGTITVDKTRVGQVAGASTVFTFDIVCADFPEYNQTLVIDTADAETASAESDPIPTGVECTVVEEGTDGWQQTVPENGAGVDVTVPGEASFTNERLEGPLQLRKSVTPDTGSYDPDDPNNTLTYTLTLSEPDPGQLDHTDVVVTDYIPGYDPDHTDSLKTTYVDGSATCSTGCVATYDADAHTLSWAVGDFNHDDDPVVFTFQVTIDQPEVAANGGIPAGVVDNIAAVESLQQPKTPSNLVKTPVVAVLPVRHERTPPKVLPFTGVELPLKPALLLAFSLITAGAVLSVRRRREDEI
jgi:hypothetical protein